jgi:glycosyltransferase involved in cell wall biosynthesis
MKIALASYQSLMLIRGGPHVVITQLKKHIEHLGVDVDYYDMWKNADELLKNSLVHLFGCNMEIYSLALNLKQRGLKYVHNPIFFTRRSERSIRLTCAIQKQINRFYSGIYTDYGLVQRICRNADLVLPNTIEEGRLINQGLKIPNEKIKVIHNGVSEEFMIGDPMLFIRQYGLRNFILNVGHIGPPRKNTLALVKALALIDHPAVIIGRITPDVESEMIISESRKNKNLLIIDGLDHHSPMLASAYAACEVFVLPSRYETPGLAALEAGLAGAKVVITPFGGTKDYFDDMAEYVNPYSEHDIRRGIMLALNKPKVAALKEHIQKYFIWPVIAQYTIDMYQQVLNQR